MSEHGRERLPNRRPGEICELTWHSPGGQEFRYLVQIAWHPDLPRPVPREAFLKPRGDLAKAHSAIGAYGEDIGECVSLLLQYGHTPAELTRRFKPGTLGLALAELLDQRTRELAGTPGG